MLLSENQWATLRAASDRLIPADQWPSASQNGVMAYFERQFAGDLGSILPLYRVGLDALDREAGASCGIGFADLEPETQDRVLTAMERGEVRSVWPIGPGSFISQMIENVAEGYYADPESNGGNTGKRSWAMIGFVERTGLDFGADNAADVHGSTSGAVGGDAQ